MAETTEQRLARLDQFQDRLVAATEALTEVIEDPELTYEPERKTLLEALGWLEMSSTCGDCIEGRCHWGGERSRTSITEAEAGREYVDPTYGRCGCSQHEVSVQARHRRARLQEAGITRTESSE